MSDTERIRSVRLWSDPPDDVMAPSVVKVSLESGLTDGEKRILADSMNGHAKLVAISFLDGEESAACAMRDRLYGILAARGAGDVEIKLVKVPAECARENRDNLHPEGGETGGVPEESDRT